jgi:uridine kinase
MRPELVLGIAGGTGSGKSTIVDRLLGGRHGQDICVLPHDAYYLDADQLPLTAHGLRNWDHPDALENQLYLEHVQQLVAGISVQRPQYDFASHARSTEKVLVEPKRILLLEGILLLAVPAIRDVIDLRVFVDTPADLRIMRRTIRDIEERGRSARNIADQYESTVRPMHEQFVEPSRQFAHVLIPWTLDNPTAVELIEYRLGSR